MKVYDRDGQKGTIQVTAPKTDQMEVFEEDNNPLIYQ